MAKVEVAGDRKGRMLGSGKSQHSKEAAVPAPFWLGLEKTPGSGGRVSRRVRGSQAGHCGYLSGTISMDHNRKRVIGHISDAHTTLVKL